ncbi:unnamed protein product [Clonostachys chloroleuca]|uniref:Uncharacterized protein n=1 Tax=Clonostachys chloroleuca TaxID=1926264 RepID=A0AA35MDS8_9HYPO|nr:unnamed protein product [Clonostachys chloroleuca]
MEPLGVTKGRRRRLVADADRKRVARACVTPHFATPVASKKKNATDINLVGGALAYDGHVFSPEKTGVLGNLTKPRPRSLLKQA